MSLSFIPVGSALLAICLPAAPFTGLHGFCAAQSQPVMRTGSHVRLRSELLSKATPHLSPKWKNPAISEKGLTAAIVSALEEQRAYLRLGTTRTDSAREAALTFSSGDTNAVCNGPAIRAVNGKAIGVVFTPEAPDNAYRIEGCSFGKIRGRATLEPVGGTGAAIPLRVEESAWTDHEIRAYLDPGISGVPDAPVKLLVYPIGAQQLELPGCFFTAARGESRLLNTIPTAWATLDASKVRLRPIDQLEYISPPVKGIGIPMDATQASAFVARVDTENFSPGQDVYDFSGLNPGWVVDSVQLQTYALSCPGPSPKPRSSGHWDTQWNGTRLTVFLRDDTCASQVSPSFTFNLSFSQYALKVWVIGPVGTQPLSSALIR